MNRYTDSLRHVMLMFMWSAAQVVVEQCTGWRPMAKTQSLRLLAEAAVRDMESKLISFEMMYFLRRK